MTNYSTWTDEQLRELATAVISEQEQRRIRREAQARMDAIAAQFEAATATEPPTPWESLTDRVGPGERVIWTDGETWRNISGAWLPTTATPETYTLGWAQETGLPDEIPEWTDVGLPYLHGGRPEGGCRDRLPLHPDPHRTRRGRLAALHHPLTLDPPGIGESGMWHDPAEMA